MHIDKKIVIKFLEGRATPQEIILVKQWMDANPMYISKLNLLQERRYRVLLRRNKDRDFTSQKEQILQFTQPQIRFMRTTQARWVASIAAIFVGVLCALGGWWMLRPSSESAQMVQAITAELECGVTLADGAVVPLSNFHNTIVVGANSVVVNGEMFATTAQQQNHYHGIRTQYGQTAEVQFVDGTQVMLNANTELQFPHHFLAEKREVHLDGEAFFEVTKSPTHPFVVHTAWRDVVVLGTIFNVTAFESQAYFSSVLVEGSIAIDEGDSRRTLSPNQAYTLLSYDAVGKVESIDPTPCTAWRKHKIPFKHTTITAITKELTQFYGVEITISDPEIAAAQLTGTLYLQPKVEYTLSALLQTLPDVTLNAIIISDGSRKIDIRTQQK